MSNDHTVVSRPSGKIGPMLVERIDHVQLAMPVHQEAEARRFYQDLLGVPEVRRPSVLAGRGGCWFEHGAVKIHLGVDPNFSPAKKAHPGFVVTDLDRISGRLRQSGYEIARGESIGNIQRIFVHDPFGNRLELIQVSSS